MNAIDKLVPPLRARWYNNSEDSLTTLTNLLVTLKHRLQGYLEEALSTLRRDPGVKLFEDARPETYVPSLFISYGLQFSMSEKVTVSLKRLNEAERGVHATLRWARQQQLLTELEQTWALYRVACAKYAEDAIRAYNATHSDRLEDTLDVVTWDDLWTNQLWTSIPESTRMTLSFPILGKGMDGTVAVVRVSNKGLAAATKDYADMKQQARELAERMMARALSFSVVEDSLARRFIWGNAVKMEQKEAERSMQEIMRKMSAIREENFWYSPWKDEKDQPALEQVAAWNRRLLDLRAPGTQLDSIVSELKKIADEVHTSDGTRVAFITRRFSSSGDDRFRQVTDPNFVAAYWVGKYVNGPYQGDVAQIASMYGAYRRRFPAVRVYLNDWDLVPDVTQSLQRYEQSITRFQTLVRDMNAQRPEDVRRVNEVREQRKAEYRLARRHDAGVRILNSLRACREAIESQRGASADNAKEVLSEFSLTFDVPRPAAHGSVTRDLEHAEETAFERSFDVLPIMKMWKHAMESFESAFLELQWVWNAFGRMFDRAAIEAKITDGYLTLASRTPLVEPDSALVKYTRTLPVPKTLTGELFRVSNVHKTIVIRELTARSRSGRLPSAASYAKSVNPADRDEIVRVMLAERGPVPSFFRPEKSTDVDEKLIETNITGYGGPKLRYREADLLWAANERLQSKLESERFTKLLESNQTSFEAFIQLLYLTMVSAVLSARGAHEDDGSRRPE